MTFFFAMEQVLLSSSLYRHSKLTDYSSCDCILRAKAETNIKSHSLSRRESTLHVAFRAEEHFPHLAVDVQLDEIIGLPRQFNAFGTIGDSLRGRLQIVGNCENT
jgi:hypothetical protein